MAKRHAATGERGTLAISTRRDGGHVVVSIADTGAGIPDAIRDRVFDLFFTTKDVGEGSGLGLTIAHAVITQRHRGELTVESTPGRGTTFTIRLPIAAALAAAA